MPQAKDHPALLPLRRRLAEEEAAYAAALAELDRLAASALPEPASSTADGAEMNELWSVPASSPGGGVRGRLARWLLQPLRPALERQARFNASLVRMLNARSEREAADIARRRALLAGLVRYAQRVEPVMDARDRVRVAEAPTDAQLVLQAFEARLSAVQEQVSGLLALRDRLEVLSEEARAVRATLQAGTPGAEVKAAAEHAARDSVYTAFENRFRGSRDAIARRQADYVALFRDQQPVVDLGCGRGEFLEALRQAGVAGRGVEANAQAARECRERGLEVVEADLVAFLCAQPAASLGGVFAAQVAEHLPPEALLALLSQAHRALRPDGLLVLETVNAACGLAFLDVFIRDLSHQRPLHTETLRFLVAAAGFGEARIEWRSPVPEEVKLHTAPSGGLDPPVARVFNENVERLNALLFAPLDYAVVARR